MTPSRSLTSPLLLASALAACLPVAAGAWGAIGHRAVGLIAEHHLTPLARAEVRALLGPESLAKVSTWADEIRSDPAWDHAAPWHYVNVEDGDTYATAEKNPAGDLIEAIARFEKVLRDESAGREKRAEALKWLVHLVGDAHQPLHVGRKADRGGNEISVRYFGEVENLHWVWDSSMIESKQLSFTELAAFLDHATPEQVREWQAASVLDWAAEAMADRAQVYDFSPDARPGDEPGDLPELRWRYLYRNWPMIEQRLLKAGIRLAGLLNDVFRGEPPPP